MAASSWGSGESRSISPGTLSRRFRVHRPGRASVCDAFLAQHRGGPTLAEGQSASPASFDVIFGASRTGQPCLEQASKRGVIESEDAENSSGRLTLALTVTAQRSSCWTTDSKTPARTPLA